MFATVKNGTCYHEFYKDDLYRRMIISELASVQGLSDEFNFIYDETNRAYKMIGNAVLVNLLYEVDYRIKQALEV